jgi:hypothetical protein
MQDLWTDTRIRDELVGKTIHSVALNEDNTEITFVTDAEPVTLVARGDCCSQCWIESLDDPEALLGTVTDVEEIEMPDLGNISTNNYPGDYSVDQVDYYGLKITTDKGRCVIDYRNDSNGYYGGEQVLKK